MFYRFYVNGKCSKSLCEYSKKDQPVINANFNDKHGYAVKKKPLILKFVKFTILEKPCISLLYPQWPWVKLRSFNKQCIFIFDHRWLFPGTESLAYVHCNLRFFFGRLLHVCWKLNYSAREERLKYTFT